MGVDAPGKAVVTQRADDPAVSHLDERRQSDERALAADGASADKPKVDPLTRQEQPGDGADADQERVCPLVISDARQVSRRKRGYGYGWTLVSKQDVGVAARQVLTQLDEGGWELVYADKLDLYGEAWGCVAQHADRGEVVLVHMQPEVIGQRRGDGNRLSISIAESDYEG